MAFFIRMEFCLRDGALSTRDFRMEVGPQEGGDAFCVEGARQQRRPGLLSGGRQAGGAGGLVFITE